MEQQKEIVDAVASFNAACQEFAQATAQPSTRHLIGIVVDGARADVVAAIVNSGQPLMSRGAAAWTERVIEKDGWTIAQVQVFVSSRQRPKLLGLLTPESVARLDAGTLGSLESCAEFARSDARVLEREAVTP